MKSVSGHGDVAGSGAEARSSLDLVAYIDVLLRYRWTFRAVAGIAVCIGVVHALVAPPVYRADVTVQVEEINGQGSADRLESGISPMLDAKPVTTAEAELLRSRMVVGNAVDNLHLDIEASPRYFPLIGRAIAESSSGLSTPGVLGWGGFAWGTESVSVRELEVPPQIEGRKLYVTALGGNQYRVAMDGLDSEVTGTVGVPLTFVIRGGAVKLLVSQLEGHAGASFVLRRVPRATVIARLQDQLIIFERGKESDVIGVSLEGSSPTLVAGILNEIANSYVDQNVRRRSAEAEKSLAFLEQQLPQFRQQVEAAESRYNAMREKRGTIDLGAESKQLLAQSVQIQASLRELQEKREELTIRFTSNHPSLAIIDEQIAGLRAQLDGVSGKLKQLPAVEQEVLRLLRDVKVSSEMLESMLNDIQELKLMKAGNVGTVRVIDAAEIPVNAEGPNRRLIVSLSMLLGLCAGFLVVFVRQAFDGGIRDAGEVEQQAGMTVYSTIPFSARRARAQLAGEAPAGPQAGQWPHDLATESLRTLHTTLQFALTGCSNHVVVISSPAPGAGKSFLCANFAAIAAAQCRVVLIDADLRRGGLHHRFGQQRSPGLTDVLMGLPLDRVLRRQVVAGLDFIPIGTDVPHSADILQSPGMDHLLDKLRSRYDVVLIDTPPVLAVADAAILAGKAGAVFLVARAESTTLSELQASERAIRQAGAEVKGVLFNGFKFERRWHRSHHHYGRYRYLSQYSREESQA